MSRLMRDLIPLIAEVVAAHDYIEESGACRCGWIMTDGDANHARHVARKVVRLLNDDTPLSVLVDIPESR